MIKDFGVLKSFDVGFLKMFCISFSIRFMFFLFLGGLIFEVVLILS